MAIEVRSATVFAKMQAMVEYKRPDAKVFWRLTCRMAPESISRPDY